MPGSGTVEFEEFVIMMQKRAEEINEEEHLRKSFKVFDKDGNSLLPFSVFVNVSVYPFDPCYL